MKYRPHDYQQFAIDYILEHPVAAVILDMGLGKTSITLTAIEQLIYDRFEVNRVLVVAPLRVARNTWSDEIKKWDHLSHLTYSLVVGTAKERKAALRKRADVYVINRENLQWLVEKSGFFFDFDIVSFATKWLPLEFFEITTITASAFAIPLPISLYMLFPMGILLSINTS